MKKSSIRFLTFCCAVSAISGGAHAVTPLSQYGQIQNVQNYSSNPFWSPGQQYNKRATPSPVYATGPDVETADCQTIVSNLVAAQCAAQNNCANMRISDIRPTIMLGLSRLPGHNYASSCAGYIDSAFDSYKAQYTGTVQPSAFPTATGAAASTTTQNEFTIKNPYDIKKPQWADDIKERATEMYQLQAQNGAGSERVTKEAFPTTINDVSFNDRMENLAAGYAPYKDANVYNGITVEKKEAAMQRQLETAQKQKELDKLQMSRIDFCQKYPMDTDCTQQGGGNGPNGGSGNQNSTNNAALLEVIMSYFTK